jgi:hypothetical protein
MIIVECNADITLVQCLTSTPRQYIIHQIRGKSGVCNQLAERSNSKGLIDEDPLSVKHPYEKDGLQRQDYSQYDIKHLYYPSENNELIVLCPKLEDWVLKSARIADIDVTRHGLPDEPNKLHRIIDQKIDEFRLLLNMLKKHKSERITILANLLKIEFL